MNRRFTDQDKFFQKTLQNHAPSGQIFAYHFVMTRPAASVAGEAQATLHEQLPAKALQFFIAVQLIIVSKIDVYLRE
jgi:hypothetical protein